MKMKLKTTMAIVSIFILLAVTSVQAQEVSFRPTYDRIDTLRSDMFNIIAKASQMPMTTSDSKANIETAQRRIETASDAELAEIYKLVGPYVHKISTLLDDYEANLMELQETLYGKSSSPAFPEAAYPTGNLAATWGGWFETDESSYPSGDSSAPNMLFSIACTRGLGKPQTDRVLYQLRFERKQEILLAELVKDVLGRLCEQEFNIAGVGGDFSLACIVSDVAYHLLRPVEEFPAICDDNIDSAEIEGSYERLGHLHGDLTTTQAMIDDVDSDLAAYVFALSTHDTNIFNALDGSLTAVASSLSAAETAILNTLNTHHTDIVNILNQNHDFFLRSSIERALRREMGNGNSTPTSVTYRIASLYLPEVNGGNLEKVRDVVADAIVSIGASGESTNGASSLLSQGDSAFTKGSYKEAWDLYADAYIKALICRRSDRACR